MPALSLTEALPGLPVKAWESRRPQLVEPDEGDPCEVPGLLRRLGERGAVLHGPQLCSLALPNGQESVQELPGR